MHTYTITFTAYGMTKTWPIEAADEAGAVRLFKDWAKVNKVRVKITSVST